MSVISVETKQLNELGSATGLGPNDLLYIETASGSKKMTYSAFLEQVRETLTSGDTALLSLTDIVDIQTNDGQKVPAASLLYSMNQMLTPLIREQRCLNEGIDGISWDLDQLMTLVKAGKYSEFAIGDSFTDGGVVWRVFAKKHYPKWAFDNAAGNEPPNHIVCLPDTSLGSYKFKDTNDNTGGYAGSLMPANMETEYAKLSAKLKGYVRQTQIYENNKSGWAAAMRNMRLPTVVEMTGSKGWADMYSGGVSGQLPLARNVRHRVKSYWYWLLDPVESNATNFCRLGHIGSSGASTASTSGAVLPLIVLA